MGPGWELLRTGCDPRYDGPQRFSKVRDYVGATSVIPIDRLGEIGAGSLGKEDARHSSRPPDEFAIDTFPGDGGLGVVVKGHDAAIKLTLLGGGQLNLLIGEAVPKLADEVEALFRAQGEMSRVGIRL